MRRALFCLPLLMLAGCTTGGVTDVDASICTQQRADLDGARASLAVLQASDPEADASPTVFVGDVEPGLSDGAAALAAYTADDKRLSDAVGRAHESVELLLRDLQLWNADAALQADAASDLSFVDQVCQSLD